MKKAAIVLFLVVLSSCGGPDPTATPNLNTPAGYRQMAVGRGRRVANAVITTNASCSTEAINQCQQTLKTQEAVYAQQSEWLRIGTRPQQCDQIAANYSILIESAKDYFKQVNTSVAQNNQAALRQTAKERMVSFNQSWNAFNNALSNDPCQ